MAFAVKVKNWSGYTFKNVCRTEKKAFCMKSVVGTIVGAGRLGWVVGPKEGTKEGIRDGATTGVEEGNCETCFVTGASMVIDDDADEPDTLHWIEEQ